MTVKTIASASEGSYSQMLSGFEFQPGILAFVFVFLPLDLGQVSVSSIVLTEISK